MAVEVKHPKLPLTKCTVIQFTRTMAGAEIAISTITMVVSQSHMHLELK
jgi:hypothetical protein